MTIVIKDREKAIAYHEALMQYSSAFLKSLRSGCDMLKINQCTLPINITSPALIAQYTLAVEKLCGQDDGYCTCSHNVGWIQHSDHEECTFCHLPRRL